MMQSFRGTLTRTDDEYVETGAKREDEEEREEADTVPLRSCSTTYSRVLFAGFWGGGEDSRSSREGLR